MSEQLGEAVDDCQTESKPPCCRPASLICTNSQKICRWCSVGMPQPVSQTSMRTLSPRRRQPTKTPPRSVYLMAFETKLRKIRPRSCGSLRVPSAIGQRDKRILLCAATTANVSFSIARRLPMLTVVTCGFRAPASSLTYSRRRSNSSIAEPRERSSASNCRFPSGVLTSFPSPPNCSAIACRGWRMSWLTVARKPVVAFAARTARSRAACRSTERCRRSSVVLRNAICNSSCSVMSILVSEPADDFSGFVVDGKRAR